MGVSGAGKTLIGKLLSGETGIPFFDADDFHPESNKNKMRSGKPLNDEDRHQWLLNLHEMAMNQSNQKRGYYCMFGIKRKIQDNTGV